MNWTEQLLPAGRFFAGVEPRVVRVETRWPDEVPLDQLGRFRRQLHRIAAMSSVGITTLSGESPRSVALGRLATTIGQLNNAADQICAMEELLLAGSGLFPDQFAHLISSIVHEFVCTNRLVLDDAARSVAARHLMSAGLRVGPDLRSPRLVSDTAAHDLIAFYMTVLVDQASLGLPPMRGELEQAGFLEPSSQVRYHRGWEGSPDGMAHWLRGRISAVSLGQVTPDELSPLLTYVAMLPEHLRGRVLSMLFNVLPNAARLAENDALLLDLGRMTDALPHSLRLTPLEAYHNSLSAVPHEIARLHLPILRSSVIAIEAVEDARVVRSRSDLDMAVAIQHEMLETSNLLGGESLRSLRERNSRSETLDQRRSAPDR